MSATTEDVLSWLVAVGDDQSRRTVLASGGLLLQAATSDELVPNTEQGGIDLARCIAELKAEGMVAFIFGLGAMQTEPAHPSLWTGYMLQGIRDLRVTMAGKAAVRSASLTLHFETATIGTLNVDRANLSLPLLILEVERQIESIDAPVELKDEARGRVASLKEHADALLTGAASGVVSQALLRALGL